MQFDAVIDKDSDSTRGVCFADLTGCFSPAKTRSMRSSRTQSRHWLCFCGTDTFRRAVSRQSAVK